MYKNNNSNYMKYVFFMHSLLNLNHLHYLWDSLWIITLITFSRKTAVMCLCARGGTNTLELILICYNKPDDIKKNNNNHCPDLFHIAHNAYKMNKYCKGRFTLVVIEFIVTKRELRFIMVQWRGPLRRAGGLTLIFHKDFVHRVICDALASLSWTGTNIHKQIFLKT